MLKKQVHTFLIQSLLHSQIHIGQKSTRWNPRLNAYLFGSRHGVFFFELKKTHLFLKRLVFFLYNSMINHKSCLFIGTGTFLHPLLNYLKFSLNQPSIHVTWVGGTLTSWTRLRGYVRFLHSRALQTHIFSRYALKDAKTIRSQFQRYLKMKTRLQGLEFAAQFPNLIVCLEKRLNEFALHEVFLLRLPLVCFLNSGDALTGVDFPVFGNTESLEAYNFYLNLILNTIKKGFLARRLQFLRCAYLHFEYGSTFQRKRFRGAHPSASATQKMLALHQRMNEYQKFFLKTHIRGFYYHKRLFEILEHRKKKEDRRNRRKIRAEIRHQNQVRRASHLAQARKTGPTTSAQ